jgi:nucleoside-diphosphate-sugar epimerase
MAMKVLLTGAAGSLGRVTCRVLVERGFDVRATDRKFRRDMPVRLEAADLCEEAAAYRLLDGCEAVVHLGNHPHLNAAPTPQQVLVQNTTMNVHVMRAAVDLGIKRIVFASSIQAMLPFLRWGYASKDQLPFLPLDGTVPANPGTNFYGLSKEFGERLLRTFAAEDAELSACALRFPLLVREEWKRRKPADLAGFDECLAYLPMTAAADLIAHVLLNEKPGYHQYFPAQTLEVTDMAVPELIRRFYARIPLKKPIDEISNLIDLEALTSGLGWTPPPRLQCKVAEIDES